MSIPDLAIVIACIAFLITQVNIERTRRRLEKGANESWKRADQKIESVGQDLTEKIQRLVQDNRPDSRIAELASKLDGIPQYLELRLDKVSANLSENMIRLQTSIDQRLDPLIKVLPNIGRVSNLGDPTQAQEASVQKRKVNEIVNKLDEAALGSSFGGRMAQILDSLGYPDLKDWMTEHPEAYPMLVQEMKRHPALAARMDQIMGQVDEGQGPRVPSNGARGQFARRMQ